MFHHGGSAVVLAIEQDTDIRTYGRSDDVTDTHGAQRSHTLFVVSFNIGIIGKR